MVLHQRGRHSFPPQPCRHRSKSRPLRFDESQGIQGQQIAPAKEECACKTVFLEAYVYGLEAQEEDSR